ncbi:ABC-type sugar transport system substrate-binding protein [Homoserinimonas aerilata]|uniref:ABC-type sugar transport system substrate-binding protein n=1 Tax=Homoserinimonas aerilata TaxID=1162970 RepID=A0A542YEN9_9MICO|nr:sugar ABC transporter substrate-binding protein [Homoserinimonas aerilata]TQL46559.1 ABC-type sugar transport system substrate-binding protein [Homoserinimonas aerilata]
MSSIHSSRSMPRRWGSAVLAGAMSIGLLAACSATGPGDTAKTEGSLSGETIAFVGYGDTSPWGAYFNSVYMPALEAEGATVLDLTTMDAGIQVQNFNQAVAQKPSVIVTLLVDTQAMVGPMRKAVEAGVPVIVVDGPADPAIADDPGIRSVLSDNVALGELAATNIIEGIKAQGRDEGNVIVVAGTQAMLVTQDRMKGFNKVFDENPSFTILDVQDGNWDPTLSGTLAQQLLAKYGPDGVQGAYGMADYMALPIINAAKQLGFAVGGEDGLIVSGGNCFKAGIESIRAGELYGTATEDPGTIAQKTAEYTIELLTGKEPPRVVTLTEDRVTAANLDEFADRCSKA